MKNTRLYDLCKRSLPDYINVWKQLVNVDCGSRNGKGINAVADVLIREFEKISPYSIEKIPMENPEEGCHLLVVFRGKGKGKIMAAAHLDTVFPEGTAAERPFNIEGDWAKGPGVADCKSGANMMLFAMKHLHELGFDDYDQITLLFNGDEEISSPSSRKLTAELAPQHDCYLCCESGQEGDGLVRSRKGSNLLQLRVTGVPSHSGNAPKKGASALMEILHQIEAIKKLEDVSRGTTLNFTLLKAGERDNIIPSHAEATADLRVVDKSEIDRVEKAAQAIAARPLIPQTTVEVHVKRGNPPFAPNTGTDQLIALAQKIYGELGKTLITRSVGGASDENWAADAGAVAVDCFGAVKGGKNHTPQECASVSSVVPRMYLLSRMFMELGKGTAVKGVS